MNKYLIAGNWKMNNDINGSEKLISDIKINGNFNDDNVEMLVCPPYTNLISVSERINGTGIKLGAQNCHWESSGALTGEISCDMLKSVGCKYTIIGHSERRTLFGETNEGINRKLHALISNSISPILCIGETLEERNAGRTFDILEEQLTTCLKKGIDDGKISKVIVAYEPVWAIGTGVAATIEQVDESHNKIREMIIKLTGESANETLILYGGSVNESNSTELFSLNNVNGALIGGASLVAEKFVTIYNNAISIIK